MDRVRAASDLPLFFHLVNTVSSLCLLHPWVQPTSEQKYLEKNITLLLTR